MRIRNLIIIAAIALAVITAYSGSARAQKGGGQHVDVAVGTSGLDFQLSGIDGKSYKLSDYFAKDQAVVVEWFNPGCPFVKKYYEGSNPSMKAAKAFAEKNGVAWLAVNSGAVGQQGNGVEVNKEAATKWGITNPILLDESGSVGMNFGAANTPQLFIFSKEGVLLYNGGVDEAKMDGEVPQHNYVINALTQYMAGETVDPASTAHIGCGVKYAPPAEEPKTAQGAR